MSFVNILLKVVIFKLLQSFPNQSSEMMNSPKFYLPRIFCYTVAIVCHEFCMYNKTLQVVMIVRNKINN